MSLPLKAKAPVADEWEDHPAGRAFRKHVQRIARRKKTARVGGVA
jgi:hypothetical protein